MFCESLASGTDGTIIHNCSKHADMLHNDLLAYVIPRHLTSPLKEASAKLSSLTYMECIAHLFCLYRENGKACTSLQNKGFSSVTTNHLGQILPIEIQFRIADSLPLEDLKSYMQSCQQMHDVGSQIIHHTIDADQETGL